MNHYFKFTKIAMRRILALAFLLWSISLSGQKFPVDTIQQNGPLTNRVNLLFLPDGYTQDELNKFRTDVNTFINTFVGTPPFSFYRHYFNFYTINVPSNESGANHPGNATDVSEPQHPVLVTDNYFKSTFDYYKIHRLLFATNIGGVYKVAAENFPQYDQIVILVNSPYYGGSGGDYATASTHTSSAEVTLHELGHSFARLADEYYAGDSYAGEKVNMTQETDPTKVRWKNWIGTDGVGIYQHCCGGNSALWYRPHQNCKMRTLNAPFCPVCTQTIIERIHQLVSPIDAYEPIEATLTAVNDAITFRINPIPIIPNTLKVSWELNGQQVGGSSDVLQVEVSDFSPGINDIIVNIEDTTALLRVDNHNTIHFKSVHWEVNKKTSGTYDVKSRLNEYEILIYPNPAHDKIHVRIDQHIDIPIELQLTDMDGTIINRADVKPGEETTIEISHTTPGLYFLRFYNKNYCIGLRKIIIE